MRQSFSFPASSHLGSAEYETGDPDKGVPSVLTIAWKRGGAGQYTGVPQDVVDRLREAAEPGKVLNAEIKNAYPYAKLA